MPAILTHQFFGEAMLARSGDAACATGAERDAFLLGNQGPDPFFYPLLTAHPVGLRLFASELHSKQVVSSLDSMRALAQARTGFDAAVADAFVRGYLCHFSLDSTAHPFVYAQQYALCDAGVPGLTRQDGSYVHAQIESDLDAMMLAYSKARDITTYHIPSHTLKAGDKVLAVIDGLFGALAREVYGRTIGAHAYTGCVRDMRLVQWVLYSPHGIKRGLIGRIERLGARHSLMQALTHRPGVGTVCAFDNHEHAQWSDPSTGVPSTEGFLDLFERAQRVATDALRLHAQGAGSALITRNLSFDGIPAEPGLSEAGDIA